MAKQASVPTVKDLIRMMMRKALKWKLELRGTKLLSSESPTLCKLETKLAFQVLWYSLAVQIYARTDSWFPKLFFQLLRKEKISSTVLHDTIFLMPMFDSRQRIVRILYELCAQTTFEAHLCFYPIVQLSRKFGKRKLILCACFNASCDSARPEFNSEEIQVCIFTQPCSRFTFLRQHDTILRAIVLLLDFDRVDIPVRDRLKEVHGAIWFMCYSRLQK